MDAQDAVFINVLRCSWSTDGAWTVLAHPVLEKHDADSRCNSENGFLSDDCNSVDSDTAGQRSGSDTARTRHPAARPQLGVSGHEVTKRRPRGGGTLAGGRPGGQILRVEGEEFHQRCRGSDIEGQRTPDKIPEQDSC